MTDKLMQFIHLRDKVVNLDRGSQGSCGLTELVLGAGRINWDNGKHFIQFFIHSISYTCCGRKVMRLIFLFTQIFIFSNIIVVPFKIVLLGSYTPNETLFSLLVTALEVYSIFVTLFWMFYKVPKWRPLRTFLSLGKRKKSLELRSGE